MKLETDAGCYLGLGSFTKDTRKDEVRTQPSSVSVLFKVALIDFEVRTSLSEFRLDTNRRERGS